MPIITAPHEFHMEDLFVNLQPIFDRRLYLKCEGFNFAGSIKLKAAVEMVTQAERDGVLTKGSILVESSSGNLGVALSVVAASKGYRFLCITDPRCNLATRQLIETLGGRVHMVTDPDPVTGFLGARLAYVRMLCASDDRYVWLNQYTNDANWLSHYRRTAPAIGQRFPDLKFLFIGAGTTGTLMGCARYFHDRRSAVRVIAVDAVGSVSFGTPPAARMIPGLGAGVRPPMLDERYVHDVVHVEERETVRTCHRLAGRGFLFGGSTGTAVSGALDWLGRNDPLDEGSAVVLSPDLGERYVDTVYHRTWLEGIYGEDILDGIREERGAPEPVLASASVGAPAW